MIESNRTMEQARRDVAAGRLTSALLVRLPMSRRAWTIRLAGRKGDAGMLLELQTLEPMVFTSVDTAVQSLEAIGFVVDQLKVQ
ncbi:MAG TPA: hypothetical protein VF800_24450 [Telluria sp.]|jgi:hypothetical protein